MSAVAVAQSSSFAFEEVSESVGISGMGTTFGPGAWGDMDGDGWPDLWVGNHASPTQLFINQGDGTFVESSASLVVGDLQRDTHGVAWADVDGDGDQDLMELVGSGQNAASQFWWNDQGRLQDTAAAVGLEFPAGRGRTPLWWDYNHDGRLDLLMVNLHRPNVSATLPFRQTSAAGQPLSFVLDWPGPSGFRPPSQATEFALLTDLTGDGHLDMVLDGSEFPSQLYDYSQQPMVDVLRKAGFQGISTVVDAVSGDFNGDGRNDLYLSRDRPETQSEAALLSDRELRANLAIRSDEIGFAFSADQPLRASLAPEVDLFEVRIGATGRRPGSHELELDPRDVRVHGILPHTPGVDLGFYVGFDPVIKEWTFLLSTPGRSQAGVILTGGPMRGLRTIPGNVGTPLEDVYRLWTPQGYVPGNLDMPISSRSVVSGDFDNDMDLDLYVVRSGAAANRPNFLLENQGDGSFVVVPDIGAVGGRTGAAGTTRGIGDGVATVDFDRDGWLDLFVTNGFGPPFFANDGPHQLFRNEGAALHPNRHWLLIDLVGPGSNREAIGAQVRVQAGGRTQLREQGGGMHLFGQNHTRLHFGLGPHSQVTEIEVTWPDGSVTRLGPTAADQLLRIEA